MPAGTESRHEFLVLGIYFDGLHYGRQGRDITWSNISLFCTRRRNRKTQQLHLLIYHPNKLSVYNMLMQLLSIHYERKTLIAIANANQHYQVS